MSKVSRFVIKRGRMSAKIKSFAQVIRCPQCNHRQFDGVFVGVVEIICPRCGDPITISCQAAPPVGSYEPNGNGNGVSTPENPQLLTAAKT